MSLYKNSLVSTPIFTDIIIRNIQARIQPDSSTPWPVYFAGSNMLSANTLYQIVAALYSNSNMVFMPHIQRPISDRKCVLIGEGRNLDCSIRVDLKGEIFGQSLVPATRSISMDSYLRSTKGKVYNANSPPKSTDTIQLFESYLIDEPLANDSWCAIGFIPGLLPRRIQLDTIPLQNKGMFRFYLFVKTSERYIDTIKFLFRCFYDMTDTVNIYANINLGNSPNLSIIVLDIDRFTTNKTMSRIINIQAEDGTNLTGLLAANIPDLLILGIFTRLSYMYVVNDEINTTIGIGSSHVVNLLNNPISARAPYPRASGGNNMSANNIKYDIAPQVDLLLSKRLYQLERAPNN